MIDLAAGVISGAGLIYSLWLLKKDLSTEAHEEVSPLITAIAASLRR